MYTVPDCMTKKCCKDESKITVSVSHLEVTVTEIDRAVIKWIVDGNLTEVEKVTVR